MIGRAGTPSMTRRFGPAGYWRRGGLGQVVGQSTSVSKPSVIYTGAGFTADCSNLGEYILNTGCWRYTLGSWQQMNAAATAVGPLSSPPTVPATSFGTSTNPPAPISGAQASAQITDVLTAQHDLQTTALQNYFGQAATSLQTLVTTDGSGIDWTTWALVAGGVLVLILVARR